MSEGSLNYFNYFTEVEEHFQQARGTSLFLMSPLDWALVESWKNADVPLEAVLRGIDAAFGKWRTRRTRSQMVNSLAFCSQAVMAEAQRMADGLAPKAPRNAPAPFPLKDLRHYLESNAAALLNTGMNEYLEIARSITEIGASLPDENPDLERLEQQLTALEQKMIAIARARQSNDTAVRAREQLDNYLRPYRGKMSAAQISMLESQFLERCALEFARLPRLSLFYLR